MSKKKRPVEGVEEKDAVKAKGISARTLGMIWFGVLMAGVLIAGWQAWRQTGMIEEFPQACDSFGYLQMAQDIRAGSGPGGRQQFTAGSAQAEALVAELRKEKIPLVEWDGMVGPQAYHAKELGDGTVRVVNQYPSGVPRLLALFVEGRALGRMYGITLAVLVLLGVGVLGAMMRAWGRRENVLLIGAGGVWAVGVQLGLMMLGTTVSYSVDFLTLPLVVLPWMLWRASGRRGWWVWGLVGVAGAVAGYGVSMRVTALLFLPGLLVLCAVGAARWRERWGRAMVFGGMAFLAGILPLMLHQKKLVGSMLRSTYGLRDLTAASAEYVAKNFEYYFVMDGALGNWALWMGALGFAAGVIYVMSQAGEAGGAGRKLRAWGIGAAVLFAVPTIYFLTHRVTTPYYALPTLLVTVVTMGMGLWDAAREGSLEGKGKSDGMVMARKIAVVAMVLPGVMHIIAASTPSNLAQMAEVAKRDLAIPAELKSDGAWIYADRFSGTLWFYCGREGVHALSFLEGSARAREVMYRLAWGRGEKQYVVWDLPAKEPPLRPALEQIVELGGSFREVGRMDGQRVMEIVWGPSGPKR